MEKDARKSQNISSTWGVSKSINDKLGAMIFYSGALDDHTFSIYINRSGFSSGNLIFGYSCALCGSESVIADGIREFIYVAYGSAIISMNRAGVARIDFDDSETSSIAIDPAKPFAVVLPANCGSFTLYDVSGNAVPITQADTITP